MIKRTSELPRGSYGIIKKLSEMLVEETKWFDGEPHLTLEQEEALQWAKDFMNNYERKHKNAQRSI